MAFLGQEEQIRELQDRFRYLTIAVFTVLILIASRLVYLQILNGDRMRHYSEENRIKRVNISAPRGMIFDRNRVLLIDNQPAFDLEVTPQYLRESGQTTQVIQHLSELIGMPLPVLQDKIKKAQGQPSFLPIKIKTDLSLEEAAKVETWKIDMPGVAVEVEIRRTAVYGDIGAHLLGFIGKVSQRELPELRAAGKNYKLGDSIGKAGIEKEMEEVLRGVDGYEVVEVDALGRRIRHGNPLSRRRRVLEEDAGVPAIPGNNLVLTIDQDLQEAAAKAFGEEKAGGLVAIDPNNGEVLAMVSRPAFDPTEFSRGISPELWASLINNPKRPLTDKTIQDHYPPGSTFKIISAIAALEEGALTPDTIISCPGHIWLGNRAYHDHKKQGFGNLNIIDALMVSSDVFFYRTAQKIRDVDTIAKWAKRFGFGSRTGVPLSREVTGLVPTEEWKKNLYQEDWAAGETLTVAIGQSYMLTTAIQNANMVAAVANGGTLYRPHMVKRVESPEGKVLSETTPEVMSETGVKTETLNIVKEGMWRVVNNPRGTAYLRRIPGADMAGKTGTAQVIRLSADKLFQKCTNMPYRFRHHGIFVGFAPKDNPKIAVAVVAEHECSGSGGAAPIAHDVILSFLKKNYPDLIKKEKGTQVALYEVHGN